MGWTVPIYQELQKDALYILQESIALLEAKMMELTEEGRPILSDAAFAQMTCHFLAGRGTAS